MKLLAILILLATPVWAGPITFTGQQQTQSGKSDDPVFVRLSDGRVVAFGQGSLCDSDCAEVSTEESTKSRKLLWLVPLAAISLCVRLCGRSVSGSTPEPSTPSADVPELATLVLLGTGLLMTARRIGR